MKRERQIGKIYVSADLMESGDAAELFARIGFTPFRVECLAYRAYDFECIGTSFLFEVLPDGMSPPTYHLTIHDNLNDEGEIIGINVTAKREAF